MTDPSLDADLNRLKELDAHIERGLNANSGDGGDSTSSAGISTAELDALVAERSELLRRIDRQTATLSSDDDDRGPRGSGPRPAG